jgi:hypothetical protein
MCILYRMPFIGKIRLSLMVVLSLRELMPAQEAPRP